jgi:hypothetical protein
VISDTAMTCRENGLANDVSSGGGAPVAVRPFPYPYKAAIAICSDLDETPTGREYFEMGRFLNTTEPTRFGIGVGLEVGNTIYFDMPTSQFSYWNGTDADREKVRALIRSGHIDCLHSFGDLATTRRHAGVALDELARHDCTLKVWIDHAVAPTNFGADIMRGSGDIDGTPSYHADLTCAFGIEYVWRGRVTSVIGQDTSRRLGGIATADHPLASAMTLGKELVKGMLARMGRAKYASHLANDVLWQGSLRSGQPVTEFLRSNPSWAGISVHDTADGLGEVLTKEFLRHLIARAGACVLYTHLGKISTADRRLSATTRQALGWLAQAQTSGDVLVTTTRRLLDLCRARRAVSWTATPVGEDLRLDVTIGPLGRLNRSLLDGLTFYVAKPTRTSVHVDGDEQPPFVVNPPDHSGRGSVSLTWPRLTFPGVR